eukprot:TRINITY_DN12397_c4_g1_i1.p3 TRINITY_DN12397_c4_g1~~TRINITY_DN12397_c4_g1_i1.p3  ORF type:complete len:205 (+),score=25.14 TRINITY_DN12397_c4_g1_i1:1663-2277(+)
MAASTTAANRSLNKRPQVCDDAEFLPSTAPPKRAKLLPLPTIGMSASDLINHEASTIPSQPCLSEVRESSPSRDSPFRPVASTQHSPANFGSPLSSLLPAAAQATVVGPRIDVDHHVALVVAAGRKLNSNDPRYQEQHLRAVLPGLLSETHGILNQYTLQPLSVDRALLLQALQFLQWLVEQHCIANDIQLAPPAPAQRQRCTC